MELMPDCCTNLGITKESLNSVLLVPQLPWRDYAWIGLEWGVEVVVVVCGGVWRRVEVV